MAKIYLLATNTKKPVSHLITAYTGEKFNHASVAFDKALAECYSFNMGRNGFVRELKEEWPAWTEFELYEVRVTESALRKARDYVRKVSGEKMTFSYRGILGVAMGRPLASAEAFFCSEFVEQTCIKAGLARSTEHAALATPLGVCKRKDAKLVASGRLHEYILLQGGGRGIFEQTQKRTKDMILEEDDDIQLLDEAGGLVSWLKRAMTNVDHDVVEDLKEALRDLKTERDRQQLLQEIDHFLADARAALRDGTAGDLLRSLGLGGVSAAGGAGAGWAWGTYTAPKVSTGFIASIAKALNIGNVVTSAQRTSHIVRTANSMAFSAFAGAAAIAFVLKTVNRFDGSLKNYVDALEALKVEVQKLRLPKGINESTIPLTEGLGSFLKNLATGDIEEEIDELEKEAADIHTPEQQRFVLTKIIRTLERLIILRHNPSAVQKFAHDHVAYFQKFLGGKDAGKELPVRTGEAITRLAKLRDKVLAKRWPDDAETERVEAYKKRIRDVLDSASKTHKDALD